MKTVENFNFKGKKVLIRVDFHIGFKVEPKINLYFREVLEDLTRSGQIVLESSYASLKKHSFPAGRMS